jgi:hypothetical protein
MRMMNRHAWLIATVTALFVLQAPICAVACLESDASDASADASHEVPACHEAAPDANSNRGAEDAPASHEDCGCDVAPSMLPIPADQPGQPGELSSSRNLVAISTSTFELRRFAFVVSYLALPCQTDRPPPDILLLKSTLLI